MRALIIRFHPLEGPGVVEDILKEEGFAINYHDAFKKDLQLIPNASILFNRIVLMGGPDSVYDKRDFFEPYIQLVRDSFKTNTKILGICLGSQIIAEVFGGNVHKGSNGKEIGFGRVEIITQNKLFEGLDTNEMHVFHFHQDTFSIPENSVHLIKSSLYPNQMFLIDDKILAIQFHIELTQNLFENWIRNFDDVKNSINGLDYKNEILKLQSNGKKILSNFLRNDTRIV
jgi:GMP synthase-like glutamine amidotransferase